MAEGLNLPFTRSAMPRSGTIWHYPSFPTVIPIHEADCSRITHPFATLPALRLSRSPNTFSRLQFEEAPALVQQTTSRRHQRTRLRAIRGPPHSATYCSRTVVFFFPRLGASPVRVPQRLFLRRSAASRERICFAIADQRSWLATDVLSLKSFKTEEYPDRSMVHTCLKRKHSHLNGPNDHLHFHYAPRVFRTIVILN
jgi:hypothetical protein